jgi:pheromone shutdown protein TraB
MNKLYIFIILIFTCQLTHGQTKLCILGTCHVETDKIKSEDYIKAFEKFKPDIILYEADTILDIRNSLNGLEGAIEFKSIHNYLKLKPKTKILPYDWTGKQSFRAKNNYWARIDSLGKVFNSYFSAGKADKLSITTFEALSDFKSAESEIDNENLETLNKPYVRKLVELKSKWEYIKIIDMANTNVTLKMIVPILQMGQNYWDIRNKEMAKNILNIVKQYPNKRILVQTGNAHKYYLNNELETKQKDNNFIIVEYWEQK